HHGAEDDHRQHQRDAGDDDEQQQSASGSGRDRPGAQTPAQGGDEQGCGDPDDNHAEAAVGDGGDEQRGGDPQQGDESAHPSAREHTAGAGIGADAGQDRGRQQQGSDHDVDMAEEEQGEDPENEVVGVGRNGGAGRDVEVAAEQAGEALAHSDVGGAQGPTGEVAGSEESVGDEAAEHDRRDDHIGHGCAQKARPAGDLEPGEGVDGLLGVADGVEFGIGVGASGGNFGG